MKIINRVEAQRQGLVRYFTGVACIHGHISPRQTVNGICCECNKLRQKSRNKDYYIRNKDTIKSRVKEWTTNNPERRKAYIVGHYRENKSDYILRANIRQKRLQATCFQHELEAIRRFYRECPEGYHVDHEIPINHPLVCGLHCVANLQYLTAKENLSKSNKWNPIW